MRITKIVIDLCKHYNQRHMKTKAIIDYNDETVTVIVDRVTSYTIGFESLVHPDMGSDNPSSGVLKDSSHNPVWDIDLFWDTPSSIAWHPESITLHPIYIDNKGMAKSDYSGSHPITDIVVHGDKREYFNKVTHAFVADQINACLGRVLETSFLGSDTFEKFVEYIAERTYEATGTWDFSDTDVDFEITRHIQELITANIYDLIKNQ